MKSSYLIARMLLGLIFVFSSSAYFFDFIPEPELKGSMLDFTNGLKGSIYFLPLLKGTELVAGLFLIFGRFVALANIILAPIILNILFVHIFMAREGLPIAIALVAGSLFLAHCDREKYKSLFQVK